MKSDILLKTPAQQQTHVNFIIPGQNKTALCFIHFDNNTTFAI